MEFVVELGMAALAVVPMLLTPQQKGTTGPRRNVSDSNDPIERAFNEASSYLLHTKGLKLDTETKLQFYGLYKVATEGPCNIPAPSMLEMVARAKWDSWNAASFISSAEAKKRYIELASEKLPQWRLGSTAADAEVAVAAAASSSSSLEKSPSDENDGFGAAVSRPTFSESEVQVQDRNLFYFIQEGNIAQVERLLVSVSDINARDNEQGMAPLHWASDRNHLDIAAKLLNAGADVDVKDSEDVTPLQYAVTCGHENMVRLLLSHGAQRELLDPEEVSSSSSSIQALLNESRTYNQGQRRPSDSSWASFTIPTSPPTEIDGDIIIVGADSQGSRGSSDEEDIEEELLRVTMGPQPPQRSR